MNKHFHREFIRKKKTPEQKAEQELDDLLKENEEAAALKSFTKEVVFSRPYAQWLLYPDIYQS